MKINNNDRNTIEKLLIQITKQTMYKLEDLQVCLISRYFTLQKCTVKA